MFFFSSRRRHTRSLRDWSSDVCSSDLIKSGIVVLGGEKDGKANLLVAFTSDLTKKYRAGDIVKELSKTFGGRGGGKPDMAQRSEERRVGKECRARGEADHEEKHGEGDA